jgi:PAS domain S-box-containing protein
VVGVLSFVSETFAVGPARQLLQWIPVIANQQAFLATLLGLALFCRHQANPWVRRLGMALAWMVTIFALLVLAEISLSGSFGIDRMIFPRGFGALSGQEFQLLSLPSDIVLLMLGIALLLGERGHSLLADFLTLSSLGYLFITALIVALRIQYVYGSAFMLPVGGILLMVLALGILCAHPDRGVMKALSSETPTGLVLRRLIPTALLGPTLIGWLWAEGTSLGLFAAPQGVFFAVLAMTLVTLGIVGWNVYPLQRLEAARNQAVAALRASEARSRHLAAIVEASDDAIVSYDLDLGTITSWSRGAETVWGWSKEEALGRPGEFTLLPERRQTLRAALSQVRRACLDAPIEPLGVPNGCQEAHFESSGLRKDGRRIDVSVSLFPIRDAEGKLFAYGSIQRDITDRKRVLEEVSRRTAELKKAEEVNRLKDHFLSTISHEMKTPLSLITGYAELLEEAHPNEENVAGIKDGSRRLAEHIDNILDYSALISGTLPLYKSDIDLGELTRYVEALEHDGFQLAGIALKTDVAPRLPLVVGDFRRIAQILLELLENARKFTPRGGKVAVRIAPDQGMVRLDVWNSGEGIPEQDFGRVWEAFSQLASGDAFRKGGLGLGLTIVKMLVELHGGKVAVTSHLGQGSTFSVFLPAKQEARAGGPQARGQGAEQAG